MNCFTVEISEPSGNILEIESCIDQVSNAVVIEQINSFSELTIGQCMAQLPSDINDIILGQIDNHLVAGTGISLLSTSGSLVIATTGLQPSGNYSLTGHQHIINDVSGLQTALDNKQPSGSYAQSIHSHIASDITDFNSSVSGLLPITDMLGGTNIFITNSGTVYTVSVSGQLGLTSEQVDDRVALLLSAGSGIVIDYNDEDNLLYISTSGLQPSGDYSVNGHQHLINDVSGLQTILDNKQPSGNYASLIHTHSSSDITNFSTSVSGLLPVINISAGSDISVVNNSGNYIVSVTGTFGLTGEEVDDRVNSLLKGGSYIDLNYEDNLDSLTINVTGLQPSGNYSFDGHSHTISDVSGLQNSLDNKQNLIINPITGIGSTNHIAYWTSSSGLSHDENQLYWDSSSNELGIGTNNPARNIDVVSSGGTSVGIKLNSMGTGGRSYSFFSTNNGSSLGGGRFGMYDDTAQVSRFVIDSGGNIGIGTNNPSYKLDIVGIGNFSQNLLVNTIPVSVSGHSHTSSDISDFNSSVSGLLPVKDIVAGNDISITSVSGVYTINSTTTSVDEADSLVTTVFNKTGSTIPKMSVVYINGGQGDMPTVTLAIANNEATSSKTYGVTAEAIDYMSMGKVVVEGSLTGLDTDQFNPTAPQGDVNGTVVYLSPSVSGGITTVKPYAPDHLVAVGTIVRTHQNEGVIEVRIQNGFELQELHNVAVTGVSDGQFLQYNSGSGLWIPSSSGNFSSLLVNGTGVSISGHTHLVSNITDFNSGVSGLFPANLVTGTGLSNHIAYWSDSGIVSADSGQLYWDSTNNRLGIGTNNPTNSLHVAGNATIGRLSVASGVAASTIDAITTSANQIDFYPDSNRSYSLTSTDFTVRDTRRLSFRDINAYIQNTNNSIGGDLKIYALNKITLEGSNVGIGTTSPSGRLHVYSTVNGEVVFNVEGTNGSLFSVVDNLDGTLMSVNNNAGLPVFEVFSDDSIVAGRFNQNDFVLTSGGNVGLGITTPSGKLHVIGTGIFSENLLVNNLPVSVSGHIHYSNDIADFNTSVSGLLTVTNITAGSGLSISSSGGNFTINALQNIINSSNLYLWANFK